MINWNKISNELCKAQNMCCEAKENDLFDMCEYHMQIIGDEDLTQDDIKQMSIFAKSVYKIAKLKKELKPLV